MKFVSKASILEQRKEQPVIPFKEGFDIRKHTRMVRHGGENVMEFIGTDNFSSAWYNRQRFEVFAGLDLEPILYTDLYETITDSTLPRNVTVYRLGPAGVVFNKVNEGGEAQFVSIDQSNYSIPINHYAVGLEYDKDLLMFNELWNIAVVERQLGKAYNAFLNDLHFSPILTYSYGANNQTAASTQGSTLVEKYLRTIEAAITHASNDVTDYRRGPYALLCSTGDSFMVERALRPTGQLGFDLQSSAQDQIQTVVAYNGWTGHRGKKTKTYSGVTTGKAYLVDLGRRTDFMRSFFKQPLQSQVGDSDASRFILSQVIWDVYLGLYISVPATVEEITWPTS